MSLFDAIHQGSLPALERALEHTRDVNQTGEGGCTPLIAAAQAGQLALVRRLLEAGAEPSWKDTSHETALLKAAANGHAAVVAVLLPLAEPDEQDLARAFLKASGAPLAPEYQYDGSSLQRKAVEVAARAASFVGHDEPQERLDRLARGEAFATRKK